MDGEDEEEEDDETRMGGHREAIVGLEVVRDEGASSRNTARSC